jgi:hypothetical protein
VTKPAPWTLRGDACALLARTEQHPPLPAGDAGSARLRGRGWGVLGWVHYTESDVGPYDELFWLVPWGLALGGQRRHCVTRMFVSSEASRDGGRHNWGIPKELARFDIETNGSQQRVRVSTETGPLASFVVVRGRRGIGVDARALPGAWRTLGQVLDGTSFTVTPEVRGRIQPARFSELVTDPSRFVQVSARAPLAEFALSGFEMRFPAARRAAIGAEAQVRRRPSGLSG